MQQHRFARKLHGEIELDLCFSCQCIWFDEFESVQLAPAGVLALFRRLHEHRDDLRQPWPDLLTCPRCQERMVQGLDVCKNGKFSYHRCPRQHGRLSSFSAFLMEKGFVRQLNGAEVKALADKVQVIRCSGCGAPVDIRKENVCSHCRAPIAILDPDAVQKALAEFGQAAYRAEHLDPNALANALIANERLNAQAQREAKATHSVGFTEMADTADLISGGIELIVGLLSDS
ncbi:MAG: hypothetical protein BWY57_00828 [Betaproteobacteria bacterium ADurb.Bin341]|nr:MAG: hypothetical protein BWY57_00828 [Betaproteobacteria bacterium ADurb.Bin341]